MPGPQGQRKGRFVVGGIEPEGPIDWDLSFANVGGGEALSQLRTALQKGNDARRSRAGFPQQREFCRITQRRAIISFFPHQRKITAAIPRFKSKKGPIPD